MYILKSIGLFVLEMAVLAYPCAMHGQDEIDAEIREEMTALHDEVRTPGLAAIRRNHNLSDDEFSARLVKLATITTNGQDATLRMFTVAAIGDFGTTNALDFLENEALRGGDISGGLDGFGMITKFDGRFFALAERMLSDKSRPNRYRRSAVYNVYRELLTSDKPFWIPISKEVRDAAKASLLRAALVENAFPVSVDDILLRSVANYKTDPQRRLIAQRITQMPEASDYVRNYFKNVLEQMEREASTTNAVSNKRTRSNDGYEPTPNLDHKDEQRANGEEEPATNEKALHWQIILSLAAIVLATLLPAMACVRHRRE